MAKPVREKGPPKGREKQMEPSSIYCERFRLTRRRIKPTGFIIITQIHTNST